MTCKHCGAPLIEGEKFCRNCGNAYPVFEKIEAETVSEPEPVKTMDDFDYEYKSSDSYDSQSSQSYSSQYESNRSQSSNAAPAGGSMALSIISMVLGLVSIGCCCLMGANIAAAVGAVVCGIIALTTGKPGRGMAITGIITGGIGILMGLAAMGLDAGGVMNNIPGTDINDLDELLENFEL